MQDYRLTKVPTLASVNNSVANSLVNINKSLQIPEATKVPSGISVYGLPKLGQYTYTPNTYYNQPSYNKFTDPYGISSLSDVFLNKAGREKLTGKKEDDPFDYIFNTGHVLTQYVKDSYVDPLLDFDVLEFVVNGVGALGEDLDLFSNVTKGIAVETEQTAMDVLGNISLSVVLGVTALSFTPVSLTAGTVAALATLGGTVGTGVAGLIKDAEGAKLGVERALGMGDEGRYLYDLDSGSFLSNMLIEFSVDPLNFVSFGTGAVRNLAPQMYKQKLSETATTVLDTIAKVGDSADNVFTDFVMKTNPVGASFLGFTKVAGPASKALLKRSVDKLKTLVDNPLNVAQFYDASNSIELDIGNVVNRSIDTYPGELKGFPNYQNHADFSELSKAVSEVMDAYSSKYDTDTAAKLIQDDVVGLMKAIATKADIPTSFKSVSNLEAMFRTLQQVPRRKALTEQDVKAFTSYADGVLSALTVHKALKDAVDKTANTIIRNTNEILENKKFASLREAVAESLGVEEVDLENYLVSLAESSDANMREVYNKIHNFITDYLSSRTTMPDFNKIHITPEEREALFDLKNYSVITAHLQKVQQTLDDIAEKGIKEGKIDSEALNEVIQKEKLRIWQPREAIEASRLGKRAKVGNFENYAGVLLFASDLIDENNPISSLIQANNYKMYASLIDMIGFKAAPAFYKQNPSVQFMQPELKKLYKLSKNMQDVNLRIYKKAKAYEEAGKVLPRHVVAEEVLGIGAYGTYQHYVELLEQQQKVTNMLKKYINEHQGNVSDDVKELAEIIGGARLTTQDDLISIAKTMVQKEAQEANELMYYIQLNKTAQTVDNMMTLLKYDEQLSDFADTSTGTGVLFKAFSELQQLPDEILGSFKGGPETCKEILDKVTGYVHLRELLRVYDKPNLPKPKPVKVDPTFAFHPPTKLEVAEMDKLFPGKFLDIGDNRYKNEQIAHVTQYFRTISGDKALNEVTRLKKEAMNKPAFYLKSDPTGALEFTAEDAEKAFAQVDHRYSRYTKVAHEDIDQRIREYENIIEREGWKLAEKAMSEDPDAFPTFENAFEYYKDVIRKDLDDPTRNTLIDKRGGKVYRDDPLIYLKGAQKTTAGAKYYSEAVVEDTKRAFQYTQAYLKETQKLKYPIEKFEAAAKTLSEYDIKIEPKEPLTPTELANVQMHIKYMALLGDGSLPPGIVLPKTISGKGAVNPLFINKLVSSGASDLMKTTRLEKATKLIEQVQVSLDGFSSKTLKLNNTQKLNRLRANVKRLQGAANAIDDPELLKFIEQISKWVEEAELAKETARNKDAMAKTLKRESKHPSLGNVGVTFKEAQVRELKKAADEAKAEAKDKILTAAVRVRKAAQVIRKAKDDALALAKKEATRYTGWSTDINIRFVKKPVPKAPEVTSQKPELNVILDRLHQVNKDASAKEVLSNKKLYNKIMEGIGPEYQYAIRSYIKAQADKNLPLILLPDEGFTDAVNKFLTTDFVAILRQMRNTDEYKQYVNPDSFSKIFGRDFYHKEYLAKSQDVVHSMTLEFKKIGKFNTDAHNYYLRIPQNEVGFAEEFNRISKEFGLVDARKNSEYFLDLDKKYNTLKTLRTQSEAMKTHIKKLLDIAGITIKDPFDKKNFEKVSAELDKKLEEAVLSPGVSAVKTVGEVLGAKALYNLHYIYNIVDEGKFNSKMYDQLNILAKRGGDLLGMLARLADLSSVAYGTRYVTEEGFDTIVRNTGFALQAFDVQDALSFLKYNSAGGTLVIDNTILMTSDVFSPEVYEELIKRGVKFRTKSNVTFINAQSLLDDDTIPYRYTAKYSAANAPDEDFIAKELSNMLNYKEEYTGVPTPFDINTAVDVRIKGDVYLAYLKKLDILDGENEDIILKALQDEKRMNYSTIGHYRFINDNVTPISASALDHLNHEIMSTMYSANKDIAYTNSMMGPELKINNLFKDNKTGELATAEVIFENYKKFNSTTDGNMIFAVLGDDVKLHRLPIESVDDVRKALELDASVMSLAIYNSMYKNINHSELPKWIDWFKKNVQSVFNAGYLTSVGTVARNFMDAFIKNYIITGDTKVFNYMLKVPGRLRRINEIITKLGNTTMNAEAIELLNKLPKADQLTWRLYQTYSDLDLSSMPLEAVVSLARKSASGVAKVETSNIIGELIWNNPATLLATTGFTTAEDMARFGLFCYYVEEELANSITDVATKVIKAHFDYGKKTPVEEWVQVFYPFYKFPLENYLWWSENAPKAYYLIKTTVSTATDEWIYRQPEMSDYSSSQLLSGNMSIGETLVKWNPSLMDALAYVPGWLIDPTEGMSEPIKNIGKAISYGVQTMFGQEPEKPDYGLPWETNYNRLSKITEETLASIPNDYNEVANLVPSLFRYSPSKWKQTSDGRGKVGLTRMSGPGGYSRAKLEYDNASGYSANSSGYTGGINRGPASGTDSTIYASRYPQKYMHRQAKRLYPRYVPNLYKQHYTSKGKSRMLNKAKLGSMTPENLTYRLYDLKYQFNKK